MTPIERVPCPHCTTLIYVASCSRCGRHFALTMAHAEGRTRTFDDQPLSQIGPDLDVAYCDFCTVQAAGKPLDAITAGLRQQTCPSCHTDFLSTHGG